MNKFGIEKECTPIDIFVQVLNEYKLLERLEDYDVFLWGNYGLKPTGDIDLTLIGEPSDDLFHMMKDFRRFCQYHIWENIDVTVYKTHAILDHIDHFNSCTDDAYYYPEKIERYKLHPLNNNEKFGRIGERLNNWYKIVQVFTLKDKHKDSGWPEIRDLREYATNR
tara:strand:+ start:1144 stop:1641 length:498 start_codon:yes stop_codon:yes gene_type:complete